MKKGIYSIKDNKTGFMSVFTDDNDACAVRNFQHACTNSTSLMYTFGTDYTLHRLGTFDTSTGVITNDHANVLVTGTNHLEVENVSD